MKHPYLYFSEDDIALFRERLKKEPELKKRYDEAVSAAEDCLNEELISFNKADGENRVSQHADFGSLNHQANRFCDILGLKYLIEGDEKCAEKIKQLLLCFISYERWFSDTYLNRTPVPWHSDLCATATTLALARCYDNIFNYLTEDERKIISSGILNKGVYQALGDWALPETRIHAVDSMGHNWWSVCISESATAFLAVSDYVPEDEKERILNIADNALAAYLTYPGNRLFNKLRNFDDRGLFYESINYGNYGTGSLLRYLMCRERYYGRNETIRNAIPDGLTDAPMKLCYPRTEKDGSVFWEFLNFGDHGDGTKLEALALYSSMTGIISPALRLAASTYKNSLTDEIMGYRPQELTGSADYLPKTEVYSSGYAVTRSSWKPDATVLAVKSGYCWNHSHNDSGEFIIWHKGKPLFIDSGTCNYDSPLYHAYYCQDVAHSVLRVGHRGRRDEELYRGTRFPGSVSDLYETENAVFIQADSTGPLAHLCSRMYRNFLWLDNRILIIFDDVYCHRDESVQLTLHFDADYTIGENRISFDNGTAKAGYLALLPEKTEINEKTGHTDHKEKENKTYLEINFPEEKRTHLLISAIELDTDEQGTLYQNLSGENADGVRVITDDGTVREIWFNRMADGHIMHDNSNNVIAGFDTDAYMLMITRRDGIEKVLMIAGSYLRRNGNVYYAGFIKKTAEVETGKYDE